MLQINKSFSVILIQSYLQVSIRIKKMSDTEDETDSTQYTRLSSGIAKRFSANFGGLMSLTFTMILQECQKGLMIIRELSGVPFTNVNLEYIPISERYDEMKYGEEIQLDMSVANFKKFQKDISYLEKTIDVTIKSLQRNGDYGVLPTIIKNYEKTVGEENMYLGLKKISRNEIRNLKILQETERKNLFRKIQEITEEIGNLKDELNDGIIDYEAKVKFLKHYEETRNEQNKMILTNKKNNLIQIKRKMTTEIERESRIHNEIVQFVKESEEEYREAIKDWINKYDDELEQWQENVHQMEIKVEEQKDEYIKLMNEYNKRQQEMDDYIKHKLEEQQRIEEFERRRKAATRIQAWWRGIMFRKGLGPFRRKKGKPKKGSDTKDSAKK